jgi:hypothetical protein
VFLQVRAQPGDDLTPPAPVLVFDGGPLESFVGQDEIALIIAGIVELHGHERRLEISRLWRTT